jgi:hypothetical protein
MTRTLPWTPALAIALTIGALVPGPAQAQVPDTQCVALIGDDVGDSPRAPDIGSFADSVQMSGDYRRVVFGTWLNRSDLPWGDLVAWQIDVAAGAGQPDYGGEYLIELDGYDGTSDLWSTYEWRDGAWVRQALNNAALWTFPDGRVYWRVDFRTQSTPTAPVTIAVRIITQHTSGGYWWRDLAPDDAGWGISLEPHGPADPLAGGRYNPDCVGGASGPGAYGPAQNKPAGSDPVGAGSRCATARQSLATVRTQLRRAKAAKRRATSRVVRRRRARAVKRLTSRRDRLARRVAARC